MNQSITLTDEGQTPEMAHPCALTFNSNDPSGAGGLTADILAMSSVGVHVLAIATGTYLKDSAETFDHVPLDEDTVDDQARQVLEDISVQVIKVGFCGSPENLSAIAELCTDYPDVPVVAYMPSLSWWQDDPIEGYQDAFMNLLLPQTTLLVGNHSTLWRWLLPEWGSERTPSARDLAKAAAEKGVPYTLVTGLPQGNQHIENALATPLSVLVSAPWVIATGDNGDAATTLGFLESVAADTMSTGSSSRRELRCAVERHRLGARREAGLGLRHADRRAGSPAPAASARDRRTRRGS